MVYFSRAGHTARMAKEIARRCESDIESIQPGEDGSTLMGRLRGAWHVCTRAAPPILKPQRNPARYELVIIGTPVSAFGVAPPVRSYVRRHASAFKRVAFFCAEGGARDELAFAELSRLCGKQPVATLAVKKKRLPPAANREGVTQFMDLIQSP